VLFALVIVRCVRGDAIDAASLGDALAGRLYDVYVGGTILIDS